MARRFEGNAAELWVRAVQDLPSDVMKFALNASLETLATNVNLHTWGKKTNTICALCSQERQTLLHVLNACPKAMVLRRYSQRHDAVLALLGDFVKRHLPSSYHMSVDLPSATYQFPQYIVSTDMQPDIVWWNDDSKELGMLELTISFESVAEHS